MCQRVAVPRRRRGHAPHGLFHGERGDVHPLQRVGRAAARSAQCAAESSYPKLWYKAVVRNFPEWPWLLCMTVLAGARTGEVWFAA